MFWPFEVSALLLTSTSCKEIKSFVDVDTLLDVEVCCLAKEGQLFQLRECDKEGLQDLMVIDEVDSGGVRKEPQELLALMLVSIILKKTCGNRKCRQGWEWLLAL